MPDLLTALDVTAAIVAAENPKMSEAEVALTTMRMNLNVLAATLATIGMLGQGLSNDSLYGVTLGIVETAKWIEAKELLPETLSQIESELSK